MPSPGYWWSTMPKHDGPRSTQRYRRKGIVMNGYPHPKVWCLEDDPFLLLFRGELLNFGEASHFEWVFRKLLRAARPLFVWCRSVASLNRAALGYLELWTKHEPHCTLALRKIPEKHGDTKTAKKELDFLPIVWCLLISAHYIFEQTMPVVFFSHQSLKHKIWAVHHSDAKKN